ncbi:MAG TPA: transglutaminase domain-containing protein, partial [Candidatus Ozemobacteraceae bacterium]|nr:transglutaminase domain-containing protein [Candidatus Ozemobacteraceae bacterium]
PYPQYLLGSLLLAKRDYVPAIRAFQAVLDRDKDGFVHDAWLRARYYAGQIDGLADAIDSALRRFPGIINRQSLERIAFSLGVRRYRLVETINVQVSDPTALQKLDFIVRLPPQIPGFQKVILEKASILADGRETRVEPSAPDADERIRVKGVEGLHGGNIKLRMSLDIERRPWLGSRGPFQPAPEPDIEESKRDERLALNDSGLDALDRRLRKEPGNFLQNAFMAIGRGLTYRENFEEHGVDWALSNPDACDCTEFSWLLTALCLRRGLPARVVTGFLVKSELIGRETNIGHAWVDVYFKGKGWVPADPTLGSTMQWAYFGNLLSDQIVFDYFEPSRKARVSVDFTSTQTTLPVTISNSYLITVLQ